MSDPVVTVAAVAFAFLLAGLVKGVLGMGLPSVAMGVLSLVMPPVQAAALLILPSFATNIWQLTAGPDLKAVLRRFGPMMAAVCLGIAIGIGMLTGAATALVSAALGAALAAYGLVGLYSLPFTVAPERERWLSPVIGFVTGLIAGGTGVFVIPAVPYLYALEMGREELIQALGLAFMVSTIALGAGLALKGHYPAALAGLSLLALLPALAGMLLGQSLRRRLRAETFRRAFFAGLVVLGSYMILRTLVRG